MKDVIFTYAVLIYNVERFLPQTIQSIIAYKGSDIEVLLINDGSTDSSAIICDKYAKMDARIRVIHQKNAGVSAARNVAIDNARGKWLIQVDGDDVVLDNIMSYVKEYAYDDADVLQFDAIEFVNKVSLDAWKPKGKELVVEGDLMLEYHRQLIDNSNVSIKLPTYNLNPAWAKAWNMNFIRDNKLYYFTDVVKGEGTLFTFTASYLMKKVRIIPKPIYGYRINPDSIMRRFSSDILENNNVQFNTYLRIINNYGELSNDVVRIAMMKRGCYLIENAIALGISHPDCNWNIVKKLKWIKEMLSYSWVQESALYAIDNKLSLKIYSLIVQNSYRKFLIYCMCLQLRNRFVKIVKIFKCNYSE